MESASSPSEGTPKPTRKFKDGDQTPFGFAIPKRWPRWKQKCVASKKHTNKEVPCGSWAVRGMLTCRMHGSGGALNAKKGLIRYLSWVITGNPKETPLAYAQYVALSAALNQLFNHGKGTEAQRLQAAMWIMQYQADPVKEETELDVRALL